MTGGRLALWWVERYTRGLPEDTRDDRRAELASDVWEHRAERGDGLKTHATIAWRCLRGVPADLSWRRSRVRGRRTLPGRGTLVRGAGWAVAAMAYALLEAQHAWFSTALVGLDLYGGDWAAGDVEWWSRVSGVLLALLVLGALGLRTMPRLGAGALAAGSVATAALMWWALPLLGPVALAVTTAAVILARRRRRTLRAHAAG